MKRMQIQKAGFKYDSQLVFRDINCEIDEGQIFCIVGPNGCGKTTLLDCVLGILKLQEGDIFLEGENIRNIKTTELAGKIAYVPQSHEKTFPYLVSEIVLMGRAAYTGWYSSPSSRDREIAENALELVGLGHLRNKPYTQISGGEGQLVMIARALAQESKIIVMDEPTSHLDFRHEMNVLETIVKMVADSKLSIIMATHFPNHAFYFENSGIPTTVAMMSEKTFSRMGSPSEILTEENLMALYKIKAKVVSHEIDDGSVLKQIIPVSTIE